MATGNTGLSLLARGIGEERVHRGHKKLEVSLEPEVGDTCPRCCKGFILPSGWIFDREPVSDYFRYFTVNFVTHAHSVIFWLNHLSTRPCWLVLHHKHASCNWRWIFKCWAVDEGIKQYEKEQCIRFWRRDSRTLASAKNRLKNLQLNDAIKF